MPVNSQHPDYIKFLSKWERCRDVAAGQDAVHEAGDKYLPKLKDQPNADYASYVKRATFYNATWRTISGLTGMVFRKKPTLEVPEAANELLDDIDGAGQPFQLLLQRTVEEGLKIGRLLVLVDYPTAPEGITRQDAINMNHRPIMVFYTTFNLINWRMGRVNNQTVLVFAVLKEVEVVDKNDEFNWVAEDRWRVLDLKDGKYRQRVFKMKGSQKTKSNVIAFEQVGGDIYPMMHAKNLDFIPAIILGTDDVSTDVDDPPLIDLVDMNLAHYRTNADYEHGCHFTGLPTLFLKGFHKENPGDKIYIGSETAIVTSNKDADAKFVEFTGQGLEALEKNLEKKEQMMAILGARMLEPQKKQVEAADSASIRRKGEESMLASVALAISLGMTKALKWFLDWAEMDSTNAKVELNKDFYPVGMTAQMLSSLLAAWQSGAPGMSDQGLFDLLKAGELVDEDTTLEEEQARIEARQQEMMQQQQDALEAAGGPPPEEKPQSKGGDIHIHTAGRKRKIRKTGDGQFEVEDSD